MATMEILANFITNLKFGKKYKQSLNLLWNCMSSG